MMEIILLRHERDLAIATSRGLRMIEDPQGNFASRDGSRY
jgi:hypothetical protein